jgi:hypothetical protein
VERRVARLPAEGAELHPGTGRGRAAAAADRHRAVPVQRPRPGGPVQRYCAHTRVARALPASVS